MKNLKLSLAVTLLVVTGCATVSQPLSSSTGANQQLTVRQVCPNEVRSNIDRFKGTREWTISSLLAVGIAEAASNAGEIVVVPILSLFGYVSDNNRYNKAVQECIESKKTPEKEDAP